MIILRNKSFGMMDFMTGSGKNTGSINGGSQDNSSQSQGSNIGSTIAKGAAVTGAGLATASAIQHGIAANKALINNGVEGGLKTVLTSPNMRMNYKQASGYVRDMSRFGATGAGKNIARMGKAGLGLAAAGVLGSMFLKKKSNPDQSQQQPQQ
jgi:hypothetical protein